MRALITGATGFVGGAVARAFEAAGHDVLAIVRPPLERLRLDGVRAIGADLTDATALATGLADATPDVVCHLAADTRMDASDEEMEANVTGTQALVEALGERLRGKRFIFASSVAAVDRPSRPKGPLTADSPTSPRSPYARSKLRCEEWLLEAAGRFGFELTILRLGTIYGPGTDKGGVVTLAEAVRGGGLAARLPWTGRISFGFVDDVAEVFRRLADRDDAVTGIHYVAETEGHTMAEVADILRDVERTKGGTPQGPLPIPRFMFKLINVPLWWPGIRSFAPWSIRCALADTILVDSAPLTELLGMEWTPLDEGLARTFGPQPDAPQLEFVAPPPADPEKPVRSIVTGATGFLGSALVRRLVERHGPEHVVGLIRNPLPEAERPVAEQLHALGVRLVPCDLMHYPVVDARETLEMDVLYHLAAETDSQAPPERLAVNTTGTRNLLETLAPRLRNTRVVLAGATAAVDRASLPRAPMDESFPTVPRTAYGRSKLESEQIVAESGAERDHRWVIPRFSPVWTGDPLTGFLKAFRDQVAGGSIVRKVAWPGRITMIHRADAVTVLIALGECGLADGEPIHVGDGNLYRYADLLRDLRRMHGDEGGFLPMPGFCWALIRRVAWLPLLRKFVPWRLSCLLGDDLAVDATRLHKRLPGRYRTWDDARGEIPIESDQTGQEE